jgi:pyrroline-5-carboxylate reductase
MQIGLVGSGNMARALASPGGTTACRLAALERGGVRAAPAQAIDDVVDFT